MIEWFKDFTWWQWALFIFFFGGIILGVISQGIVFALVAIGGIGVFIWNGTKHFYSCIKNIKFSGRANRKEYWMFLLFYFIFSLIISFAIVYFLSFIGLYNPYHSEIVPKIYFVLLLAPHLAVSVRRLHDVNLSGWLASVPFVPLSAGLFFSHIILDLLCCIGMITFFVFAIRKGEKGSNKYGTDPNTPVKKPLQPEPLKMTQQEEERTLL